MQVTSIVAALAYAGLGAGVGTIGAAVIQTHSAKGESRAHAADLLAEGYGGLADRLGEDNEAKTREIRSLRGVLLKLTDATDLLLDAVDMLMTTEAIKLSVVKEAASTAIIAAREANRVAKLTL